MIFSSPDPAADPYFASALLTLQRTSYALEAALIGDDRLPPLLEDEVALVAWRGHWRTAWDGVELVGAVAWSESTDLLDIEKLMVSPHAVRRGVATSLLTEVIAQAGGRELATATGRDNTPAVALYGKHGFRADGDERVPPGIWITRLRRASQA